MFEFFGKRLQRDLKQIVDTRITASETSSGNLMKVRKGIAHQHCLMDALPSVYSPKVWTSMSSRTRGRGTQFGLVEVFWLQHRNSRVTVIQRYVYPIYLQCCADCLGRRIISEAMHVPC